MVIDPKVRQRRIKQMKNLYDFIMADNEDDKEFIYKIIKETINDNKEKMEKSILNLIYKILEKALSITLSEARRMYKSFNEDTIINLADMLYHKDGKTLEDRVHGWINENNVMNLFYHICLIIDTETYQLIHQTIKEKANIIYVEIIGEGGCDTCAEYCDGEIYKEGEIELPPYHPGCMCEVAYYEKEDVLNGL